MRTQQQWVKARSCNIVFKDPTKLKFAPLPYFVPLYRGSSWSAMSNAGWAPASMVQRHRSRTVATRPRSSILMTASTDRRLSLGEHQNARNLAWSNPSKGAVEPDCAKIESGDKRGAMLSLSDRRLAKRKCLAIELYETEKAYVNILALVDKVRGFKLTSVLLYPIAEFTPRFSTCSFA